MVSFSLSAATLARTLHYRLHPGVLARFGEEGANQAPVALEHLHRQGLVGQREGGMPYHEREHDGRQPPLAFLQMLQGLTGWVGIKAGW